MSTQMKIFIAIAVVALVIIVIIVISYNKRKGPSTESTTYTKQTSGLSAVGGIGDLASLFSLSDERYKTGISETGYGAAWNKVKAMKPIDYMFTRSDGTRPCPTCDSRKRVGFSAQQLEKVDPNLVIEIDGKKYIDNAQLTALNTATIKQLMETQEYLKGLVSSDAVQGGGPTNTRVM